MNSLMGYKLVQYKEWKKNLNYKKKNIIDMF